MLLHLEIFALVFTGTFLLFSPRRSGLEVLERLSGARTVSEEDGVGDFRERVLKPWLQDLGGLLARLTPAALRRQGAGRLALAGRPWSLEIHYLLKALLTALALGLLLAGPRFFLPALVLVILANRLPDFFLARRAAGRRHSFLRFFPDVLDLLAISVEAGLGLDAALNQVSQRFPEPITGEFGTVLSEIRLGRPRAEALRGLSGRLNLPELTAFVSALNQAETMGVGITEVLRIQAETLRARRAQSVQERVMKVPIKMLFPLIFFILPALFLVLLGPIALSLKGVLFA